MRRYFRKVSTWPDQGSGGGANEVELPIPQADLPTASGTGNAIPEIVREAGATGQTANTPRPVRTYAKFAATGAESLMWTKKAPSNYLSGGTAIINWKSATGTSNAVVWKAALAPVVPSSTDDDALVFNAATIGSGTPTATVQGRIVQTTLALTTSGLAADRQYTLMIGRHATGAADTMTSDAILTTAAWTYTG